MALTRRVIVLAGVAALGGCGFALRRAPELRFRTIALRGFAPRSALAAELRMHIDASQTTLVVPLDSRPQAIFEALADARERSVVASTAAGQVRELQLRSRLRFRLLRGDGQELIAPSEIVQSRDMSYSETAALAKELEEAALYRAMQSDIVAQVMRRLAAVPTL